MTGRLQLIEQKLLAIDSAGFQNLCDRYLLLREEEFISSESFEIRHPKYQKKSFDISDGNARLAVMAAKIAREQQQEFLWGLCLNLILYRGHRARCSTLSFAQPKLACQLTLFRIRHLRLAAIETP